MGFRGWAGTAGIALLGFSIYQLVTGRAIANRYEGANRRTMIWIDKAEEPKAYWLYVIGTLIFSLGLLALAIFAEG